MWYEHSAQGFALFALSYPGRGGLVGGRNGSVKFRETVVAGQLIA